MRGLFVKILGVIYKWVKSSRYLSRFYYDVANISYFANLQLQETMLADKARVDAYYDAIHKHVQEGDLVIDLGTGTGILSFFAAPKAKTVYALEHGKIIELAKAIADRNEIRNIEFLNINSKNFVAREKVDVIVQEQMGALLFSEYMVENVVDLRERVLKTGGKILPSKFELFIEPVKLMDKERVPFIWEQKIHGVSFESVKQLKGEVSSPYGYRLIKGGSVDYLLCEPQSVLAFDLETVRVEDIPKEIRYVRSVSRAGRLDGFCVYFNAIFDEEISLSTSPLGSTTCWSLPLLRAVSEHYKKGDSIEFSLTIEDAADINTYRWTWGCIGAGCIARSWQRYSADLGGIQAP